MNFSKDELIFVPLGGAGEIGMNVNLYHYKSDWLMIDLGISFSDEITLATGATAAISNISATFDSSQNKVILAYRAVGSNSYGTAMVVDVSSVSSQSSVVKIPSQSPSSECGHVLVQIASEKGGGKDGGFGNRAMAADITKTSMGPRRLRARRERGRAPARLRSRVVGGSVPYHTVRS